ncbi:sulfatase [Sunxiuqinia elliptica]|uniref:Arylsulfatase A-like enzyme n=1 Tax=Sunxiuqinia elliptica TaxID=655355 RepID=A0A4R6HAH6_9BACT|nr:sulfatase [Sunxiuqinia elliptica]TDO05360.1 arylsulfatase A-like enzyme [Sunxiuqinia elliptica]TDO64907.1 arylsulfatase A-like enzyme [Sunxiuqinia elliptica]
MKEFKALVILFLAGLTSCSQKQNSQNTVVENKPNVLFILIDDLGWQDLECYGSTFYETPNIDKIRSEGIMFTNAYSACPVCSPTRASILTGKNPAHLQFTGHITRIGRHRYPEHGRIVPPHDKMHVELDEVMIPEALNGLGYATVSIGKWHVGDKEMYFPTHQGFDQNIAGYEDGSPPTYWGPYELDRDWNSVIKNLPNRTGDEYLTDRLTDEAIKFIKDHKERPFFMYLSHYAVHTPLEAPDSLVHKYEEKLKKNPVQKSATYAAMVEKVDDNVGRLLDEVDKLGLTDNTIVIFYSDNGGTTEATINTPLREGKGFLYEGGIRVPLMVKWPGHIKPDTQCDVPVISDDLYPTIMAMIGEGTKPGTDIDGVSLLSLMEQQANELGREQLCWYYPHYSPQAQMPGYAIRKGNYKLIEHYDPIKLELFDLSQDLSETHNLAEEMPEKVNELKTAYQKWLIRMKPVMHALNPNYIKSR